ncbi:Uncharacterised protein [Shimwellia blattae]|nr:Uncharacterised protein [Shimwellia blattae]VEC22878.1 Uncharacterised protein [Shimwellia blattae]
MTLNANAARSSRLGINTIFDECRANWQGYQIHKIFSGVRA